MRLVATSQKLREWADLLRDPVGNTFDRDEALDFLNRLRMDLSDRRDMADYLESQAAAIEAQDAKAHA